MSHLLGTEWKGPVIWNYRFILVEQNGPSTFTFESKLWNVHFHLEQGSVGLLVGHKSPDPWFKTSRSHLARLKDNFTLVLNWPKSHNLLLLQNLTQKIRPKSNPFQLI